jgi:flavin-dependent dehydrogenase
MKKILGAGLSGLAAAINLKKGGEEVLVLERNASVGMQIHPNYQALRIDIPDRVDEWFASIGLKPHNPTIRYLSKMILETPRTGIRRISSRHPAPFALRGGQGSLEWALYQEALDLGIRFEFNTRQRSGDIIAFGHPKCDAVAYGEVYELPDFPEDEYFYMHDDRYSPKGWYAYAVPMGGGHVEIVNCVSQPNVSRCKELFHKLLSENAFLKGYVKDKKPISAFGGFGSVDYPKTAKHGGALLVGEAAGFQDVSRGFGIAYALRSGHLAAKALLGNLDYDELWKKSFDAELRLDFATRFALTIFGDRLVEWYFRDTKDNAEVDFADAAPKGLFFEIGKGIAFPAEMMKKRIMGHW